MQIARNARIEEVPRENKGNKRDDDEKERTREDSG
jgi:hypothetical protein